MLPLPPAVLHVWRNWAPLIGYLRRRTLVLPVAACLAAAAFMLPGAIGGSAGGGAAPPVRAATLLTQVPLTTLAPILRTSPDWLQASLRQRGYRVASTDVTLATIAAPAGIPGMRPLIEMLPAP